MDRKAVKVAILESHILSRRTSLNPNRESPSHNSTPFHHEQAVAALEGISLDFIASRFWYIYHVKTLLKWHGLAEEVKLSCKCNKSPPFCTR